MTLVGLQGKLDREIEARVRYAFDAEPDYDNVLTIVPSKGEVIDPPERGPCSKSGRSAPTSCIRTCEVTGGKVLRHLLVESAVSGRLAFGIHDDPCDERKASAERRSGALVGNG